MVRLSLFVFVDLFAARLEFTAEICVFAWPLVYSFFVLVLSRSSVAWQKLCVLVFVYLKPPIARHVASTNRMHGSRGRFIFVFDPSEVA